MANPVIATVARGTTIESRHRGAFAVCDAHGKIVMSAGDVDAPVFPRSAIKAFQCVPLIESGAAQHFGLDDEEIALCCASHEGEADHLRVAGSILRKAGNTADLLACGAHYPAATAARHDLVKSGGKPLPIHNTCSGKHAGMLALARHLGANPAGYGEEAHAVQKAVADTIAKLCGVDIQNAPVGIDGCAVPTWALPLGNLARGFARLADPEFVAGAWIIRAARSHPRMIAGSGRYDTRIMQAVPRLFIKYGAEGVYCGVIAHAHLGFALKCDDGALRAAETAIAGVLLKLDVWSEDERLVLGEFSHVTLKNWRKLEVGDVRSAL